MYPLPTRMLANSFHLYSHNIADVSDDDFIRRMDHPVEYRVFCLDTKSFLDPRWESKLHDPYSLFGSGLDLYDSSDDDYDSDELGFMADMASMAYFSSGMGMYTHEYGDSDDEF